MSILLFFFIFSFVSCTSSSLMTKRDPPKGLPLPPRLNQASSGWHSELLRNGVNKPLATIFITAFLMIEIGVTPARAAIGEGDLPDGALAFQKVTKAQKEWKKFAVATEKRKDENIVFFCSLSTHLIGNIYFFPLKHKVMLIVAKEVIRSNQNRCLKTN
jgi:hypothetical protein